MEYRDHVGTMLAEACKRQVPGDAGIALGHQVVSVFNEAFNNAVFHAYDGNPDGMVEIWMSVVPPRLELRVADNGKSFDPLSVPPPDLDTLPERGMGLYIMRAFMDEVHYTPGSPNVLTLIKKIETPTATEGDGKDMFEHSRTDKGDITILALKGSLNALTAPEFKPQIDALVGARRLRVIVDLSGLELIDSSGVGAIVSLFKRLRMIGGDVKIAALQGQPKEIFRILRLEKAFEIAGTVEEAERRFQQ